ncbi:hypothetical protein KDL01_00545 [Actinospica durhamensis]|uniref:Uncharacterized protein n=1 Tax=Actinospica durhamensis TaxID=1508375 RepID=A0A941EQ58_9ACTN|nr:hypothetical protein [Actinospica durhamensis]MBR7831724.1 hypothetical protein [Actinospica durhamensis]
MTSESSARSGGSVSELIELLQYAVPVLERFGNPKAEIIRPELKTYSRWKGEKTRCFECPAWLITYHDRPGGDEASYLGFDGTRYKKVGLFEWWITPIAELSDMAPPVPEVSYQDHFVTDAIKFLHRLVREAAPQYARPLQIQAFGAVFEAVPLPRDLGDLDGDFARRERTKEQELARAQELRCEDVAAGYRSPGAVGVSLVRPADRLGQIRYTFLSWLRLITETGWYRANPDRFLRPMPPHAPGGPIRQEEIAGLASKLISGGSAQWIDAYTDEYSPTTKPLSPPFRLVLTPAGITEADLLVPAGAGPDRTRALIRALMLWSAREAKSPAGTALQHFLAAADCEIDGVIASAAEVFSLNPLMGNASMPALG